jgi:hypothetical protein
MRTIKDKLFTMLAGDRGAIPRRLLRRPPLRCQMVVFFLKITSNSAYSEASGLFREAGW